MSPLLALALGLGQTPAIAGGVAYAEEEVSEEALVAQAEQLKVGANRQDVPVRVNLPLLKGASLGFGEETFGIDNGTLPGGVRYVSIGVDNRNESLMKDLLSGKTTLWENAQKSFANADPKGKGSSFKPKFKVAAICQLGGSEVKGDLALLAKATGAKHAQYLIFTGEVGMTGLIGARVPWTYTAGASSQADSLKAGLSVAGDFAIKLAGGIGVARLGRFGIYGKSTAAVDLTILPSATAGWNKARLTGEIGAEALIGRYRIWHTKFWSGGPWDLVTPRPLKAQSEPEIAGPVLVAAADGPLAAESYDYVADAGSWLGSSVQVVDAPYLPDGTRTATSSDEFNPQVMTNEYSTPQEGMRLLQQNVYPDASVAIVDTPDGAIMCWVAGGERGRRDDTTLMWSRRDRLSDVWSEPKSVRRTTTGADLELELFCAEDGSVHVVWLGTAQDVSPDADLRDLTSGMQVMYASLGRGAQEFGPVEVVAEASAMVKTSPEVAAGEGGVICGWTEVEPAHLLDYEGRTHLLTARRAPGGWSVTRTEVDDVTSMDAGLTGHVPCLAWTVADMAWAQDGTVTSTPSQLYVDLVDGTRRAVDADASSADFALESGRNVLTWSKAGSTKGVNDLMALDAASGAAHRVFADIGLPPNYQVEGDLATNALFTYPSWESSYTDPDKSTTDVYGRTVVGSSLSGEALLVSHADDLTAHDVAFVDGSPIVVAVAERGIGAGLAAQAEGRTPRSADLLVARGDALERLAIGDVLYDGEAVRPGATVPVSVSVLNAGLDTIEDGVRARVVDDATGKVLGEGSLAAPLRPSEQGQVSFEFRVPADMGAGSEYQVSVKTNFCDGTPQAKDSIALNLDLDLACLTAQAPYAPVTPSPYGGGDLGWYDVTPSNPGGRHSGGRYYSDGSSSETGTARVRRLAGPDRYDTMRQVVPAAFERSEWAVLASGADFPDALSALALAGAHHAPVLLTTPEVLSPAAASELRRLGCTHLVCVGGTAAVSEAALDEARAIVGSVVRVAGPDRQGTAVAAMREARAVSKASDTVIVATGQTFADALSAGPWSFGTVAPVVLTTAEGLLTDEAVAEITGDAGLRRVVMMGGEAAVADGVRAQLGDAYEYVRLAGPDRYRTSEVAAEWFSGHGITWERPFVATGTGYADALSAAAVAGMGSSPLLLVNPRPNAVPAPISAHAKDVSCLTIVGGTSAIGASFEDLLRSVLS